MGKNGGARPGAGRPPLSQELKTADLARKALIDKFGGLNEALIAILQMNNPLLTKFVLEHAFGKPTDNINLKGEMKGVIEYDLTKVKTETLKELVNAATSDKPS